MVQTPTIAGDYTFDPFARHQFYHDVNESLVRMAVRQLDAATPPGQRVHVLELASGTGAVTELILNELDSCNRPATVTGVEPSFEAIDVARARLGDRDVSFAQGDIDRLVDIGKADAVFFCNAIHLVPDKRAVIDKIAGALRPGGLFACNSSFFDGAYAPGSESFYHLWIRRALGWMRQHYPEVRTNRNARTPAMQWLNVEQYTQLLAESKLKVVSCELERAMLPVRSWQDIGRYWLFIEGALPGVPIPVGADALEYGAAEAANELQITEVPRNWLQLVAQLA